MPLWPGQPPDTPAGPLPKESVLVAATPEALTGGKSVAAFDVTIPTMSVYPPQGKSNGIGMLVFPGGGFKAVVLTLQGTEICSWLTARGYTCLLVKYRVPKTGHHYEEACDCGVEPDRPRALQDAQRAVRVARAKARELGIDADKIGVMGFSAGGYLAVQLSNIMTPAYAPMDAIDRLSSRPYVAVAMYPGHLCRPSGKLDPGIQVTRATTPTFLAQAWDDPVDEVCNATVYADALAKAGVPAEVHLFAKGGHAFALRKRDAALKDWPDLVMHWLARQGVGPTTVAAAR
jgi:acetyl esterase/lipase